MYYYIDGYNLIFSLGEKKQTLQRLREEVVLHLQKRFALKKMSGTLVFDGAHKRDEESGLSYPSPLIVAFAPKGQSADEYIVECLQRAKNPKQITVVTNDKGLQRHAGSAGAKVLFNEEFLHILMKKKSSGTAKDPVETKGNIERLEKIFEERLKRGDED